MRAAILLCVGAVLPAGGCTYAVVASGKNLQELDTSEQVRAAFGTPVEVGVVDGKPYEGFHTRCKIAEPDKVIYLLMGDFATFGFGELVWFPQQSFIAARRSIRGQKLRFVYDETGHVLSVTHDGEYVSLPWRPWREARDATSSPTTPDPAAHPADPPRTPPGRAHAPPP